MTDLSFSDVIGPLVQPGYRLACALLHDPELAEDVVQEASVIAWRKIKRLESPGRAPSWFFGIVANECRNARRTRWLRRVSFGIPHSVSIASGEDRWVTHEDVRHALGKLSHKDRLAVSLYFYLDLPMDDVAAVLGSSTDATRKRLHRAVRRLRPDLAVEEALR